MQSLLIQVVPEVYGIMRLGPKRPIPSWFESVGGFRLSARTPAELTLLLPESEIPPDFEGKQERGWRAMYVAGTLDFGLVGIMAKLSGVLAEVEISILAMSTFDTDWLFVKEPDLERGLVALEAAGIQVERD